jgi:hypothetical protein
MPAARRLATLVAFVHCLEATAQDEVLEVLEMLLHDLFGKAITANQKARPRSLKDLDESAAALAGACRLLLDPELPDEYLRKKVFAKIPRASPENALERVSGVIYPMCSHTSPSKRRRLVGRCSPPATGCAISRTATRRIAMRPAKSSTRPGSVTSCRKTAASIFGPTPFACSANCRLPFTGATCLPARVGATPIREPICYPMPSGKRHARSSAARSAIPGTIHLFPRQAIVFWVNV